MFKATDRSNGKEVACKFISKKNLSHQGLVNISREISIMKRVHHKNIVELLGVFETDSSLILVLELFVSRTRAHAQCVARAV